MFQRAKRLMPGDMAVQDSGTVVGRQPLRHQRIRVRDRAILEHRVQQARARHRHFGAADRRRVRSARVPWRPRHSPSATSRNWKGTTSPRHSAARGARKDPGAPDRGPPCRKTRTARMRRAAATSPPHRAASFRDVSAPRKAPREYCLPRQAPGFRHGSARAPCRGAPRARAPARPLFSPLRPADRTYGCGRGRCGRAQTQGQPRSPAQKLPPRPAMPTTTDRRRRDRPPPPRSRRSKGQAVAILVGHLLPRSLHPVRARRPSIG